MPLETIVTIAVISDDLLATTNSLYQFKIKNIQPENRQQVPIQLSANPSFIKLKNISLRISGPVVEDSATTLLPALNGCHITIRTLVGIPQPSQFNGTAWGSKSTTRQKISYSAARCLFISKNPMKKYRTLRLIMSRIAWRFSVIFINPTRVITAVGHTCN